MAALSSFEGNEAHFDLLRRAATEGDCEAWNKWRQQTPAAPDLRGLEMPGARLPGVDLSGASLIRANLQDADLRGAKLSHATLVYANLQRARLDNAQVMYANLEEAQLTDAELPKAVLRHSDLTAASFKGANLRGANLGRIEGEDVIFAGADLTGSDLEKADLWMADLAGANLCGSNLRDANLNQAKLQGARLDDTDLIRARLTGVNLCGARIERAKIYGLSAWDIKTDSTTQQRALSIAPPGTVGRITVDDIEIAQFVNLLVDHKKLRKVITAVANKGVLILGRFSDPPRKAFLESLADTVRKKGLLPIIYDFERPKEQDWTETVQTLASMSLFVIADITSPASVPLELQATVPHCMVPFVPLHKRGTPAFSMFKDLQKKHRDWVGRVRRYSDEHALLAKFDEVILAPALEVRRRLNARKAEDIEVWDVDAPDSTQST